ncbi:MAG: MTAP family purine nucleoside phosphorylase [Candidatus Portnoybacteria bacterium]|nr:MTAP family purine nucleoside phosphorylase [Candidatus Portnoybacteria bacterium]
MPNIEFKNKNIKENNKRICFIGGTSLFESDLFGDFKKIEKRNKFGKVAFFQKSNLFFIQRHLGGAPPHRINLKAYFQALEDLGVKKIISICSVGCLKKNIKIPAMMVPHDFIGFWNIPTFFDNEICHSAPGLSGELRKEIISAAKSEKVKIIPKGIYFQASGPRIETPAEVKIISKFGNVVGMTFASEATLACEKNIEIAAICTVDNYANGLKGGVNYDIVKAGARKNKENLEKILGKLI